MFWYDQDPTSGLHLIHCSLAAGSAGNVSPMSAVSPRGRRVSSWPWRHRHTSVLAVYPRQFTATSSGDLDLKKKKLPRNNVKQQKATSMTFELQFICGDWHPTTSLKCFCSQSAPLFRAVTRSLKREMAAGSPYISICPHPVLTGGTSGKMSYYTTWKSSLNTY